MAYKASRVWSMYRKQVGCHSCSHLFHTEVRLVLKFWKLLRPHWPFFLKLKCLAIYSWNVDVPDNAGICYPSLIASKDSATLLSVGQTGSGWEATACDSLLLTVWRPSVPWVCLCLSMASTFRKKRTLKRSNLRNNHNKLGFHFISFPRWKCC